MVISALHKPTAHLWVEPRRLRPAANITPKTLTVMVTPTFWFTVLVLALAALTWHHAHPTLNTSR
jgi:hypothetical protein